MSNLKKHTFSGFAHDSRFCILGRLPLSPCLVSRFALNSRPNRSLRSLGRSLQGETGNQAWLGGNLLQNAVTAHFVTAHAERGMKAAFDRGAKPHHLVIYSDECLYADYLFRSSFRRHQGSAQSRASTTPPEPKRRKTDNCNVSLAQRSPLRLVLPKASQSASFSVPLAPSPTHRSYEPLPVPVTPATVSQALVTLLCHVSVSRSDLRPRLHRLRFHLLRSRRGAASRHRSS
ncbi:MAG: hypothetical protein MHM6MM_004257 [Cercozoa sp. M6MM]